MSLYERFFFCSTCFECFYIHPQELTAVRGCSALFRYVLVYWCGSAGLGWYPNAGWSTSAPIHQYTPKQNNTPTYSRRLLRMNVITLETCLAMKNVHKVTSSWFNLFNKNNTILFYYVYYCIRETCCPNTIINTINFISLYCFLSVQYLNYIYVFQLIALN